MSWNLLLEIIATVLSLAFLFLSIKEYIACWIFGILSSLISIYLFFTVKLYSEACLYFFYVLIGFYGWYKWKYPPTGATLPISKLKVWQHFIGILCSIFVAILLGYTFQTYTDADKSYIDAHTTIFSLFASYLEANKYLYTWLYWIVINGVSVWLYFTKGLSIYAGLMLIYFIMSGVGLWSWQQRYNGQKAV